MKDFRSSLLGPHPQNLEIVNVYCCSHSELSQSITHPQVTTLQRTSPNTIYNSSKHTKCEKIKLVRNVQYSTLMFQVEWWELAEGKETDTHHQSSTLLNPSLGYRGAPSWISIGLLSVLDRKPVSPASHANRLQVNNKPYCEMLLNFREQINQRSSGFWSREDYLSKTALTGK